MAIIEVWKFKILSDHYINQKTITRGQIKNQAETWFKTLLIERLTESFISEKGWIFYQSLKKLVLLIVRYCYYIGAFSVPQRNL